MRLTAELINNSLSYLNPVKERELDLRGHKIPTIENLGVARGPECIDFTDNDLSTLGNFPSSPRLHTLLCARNRISSIQPLLSKSIPVLTTLVLAQNNIAELADLEPLKGFSKLTHVSLIENPVTSKENYRYWILHLAPQIHFLDFQKVKDSEREKAIELFGTLNEPSSLAKNVLSVRSKNPLSFGAATLNGATKGSRIKLSGKERKRIEELIRNAKSLAEVQRLEKDLNEGRIPAGIAMEDMMDET